MRRFIIAPALLIAVGAMAVCGLYLGWFDRSPNIEPHESPTDVHLVFKPDQSYGDGSSSSQSYDLFAPRDYLSKSYPILIWIHGGGWAIGDKSDWPPRTVGRQAATLGFVAFAINYRLNSRERPALFPAASNDVGAFVQFLGRNLALAHADASTPISIAGQSAGGQLALYEAANPDSKTRYRCVIDVSGVTDLTAPDLPDVLVPLVQGIAPTQAMRSLASPIRHVESWHADRILFLHAQDDATVPIRQATAMHDALSQLKNPPQMTENFPEQGGHDLSPLILEKALQQYLPRNCR